MRPRGPATAAVPGWSLAAAAVLATALVALLARDPARLLETVRWAGVTLAVGVTGLLDDPSAELHASLPTPDRRVRIRALALLAPALLGAWIVIAWAGERLAAAGSPFPGLLEGCIALARRGLGVEAFAMLALALAAAGMAARYGGGVSAAVTGGTTVIMLYAARMAVPQRWTLGAAPLETGWRGTQLRWTAILVVAAGVAWWVAGDRWRRPDRRRRMLATAAAAAVLVLLFATSARPRPSDTVVAGLVSDQGLAAAELSSTLAGATTMRFGDGPGAVASLTVTLVTDGGTVSTQLPVDGMVAAATLRTWVASVPEIGDQEFFARAVASALPPGLRLRAPDEPATGTAVAEVVTDRRGGDTIASVATPGDRTCGVSIAGAVARHIIG